MPKWIKWLVLVLIVLWAVDKVCFASDTLTMYPGTGDQLQVTVDYQSGTGGHITAVCPNDILVWDDAGGSVTIVAMDPSPSDPCLIHCQVDPPGGYGAWESSGQGLCSYASYPVAYDSAKDILYGFITGNAGTYPTVTAGHSMVFALGHTTPTHWYGAGSTAHGLRIIGHITVLAAAPSPATNGYWFRPYWGATAPKIPEYNTDNINFAAFANVAAVSGSPTYQAVQAWFCTCIWDDLWDTAEQNYHWYNGSNSGNTYGGTLALQTAGAVLKLCESGTNAEKLTLAKYFLQFGLDTSRQIEYANNHKGIIKPTIGVGGHFCGRLLPVLAVAQALNDSIAQLQISHAGDPYINTYDPVTWKATDGYNPDVVTFGETFQAQAIEATDILGPPWNLTVPISGHYHGSTYTTGDALFTQGWAAVVGSGTVWTGMAGRMMMCRPDIGYPSTDGVEMEKPNGRAYTIKSVADDTHLTLDRVWTGSTNTYAYGIATDFVALGVCNSTAGSTGDYVDTNDPTPDLIGAPIFRVYGLTNPTQSGVQFPWAGGYEDIGEGDAHAYIMGMLLLGADSLGTFTTAFNYWDGYAYQALHPEAALNPQYKSAWHINVYNAYRATMAWPIYKSLMPNAGPDQTVPYANRNAVQLTAAASKNYLLHKYTKNNVTTETYTWSEGITTIATGAVPAPIALAVGTHNITLTLADVRNSDTETDGLVVTVSGTGGTFLLGRK
jgi:hypothetical protein